MQKAMVQAKALGSSLNCFLFQRGDDATTNNADAAETAPIVQAEERKAEGAAGAEATHAESKTTSKSKISPQMRFTATAKRRSRSGRLKQRRLALSLPKGF